MSDRTCPACGNRVPERGTKRRDGETFCTPITCASWTVTHIYDKHTRSWVPEKGAVDVDK